VAALDSGPSPAWLRWLERRLGWLAVPNIAILFVTLQALGFLMVLSDPVWVPRLALIPPAVTINHEYWRLVTFLALPLSTSPIWVIFTLWFLYFVINLIETEWGAFKTTLYVLVSIVVTIAFSFLFNYPVLDVSKFESSLFLAAAALFPEMTVYLLVVPVKIKWLAWLTLAMLGWEFIGADWLDRFFTLAILSNYLLFFGPSLISRIRQYFRRRSFQRQMRR
jgi:membrane associated rhomboid family serine protease